jgi:hypothetical protein
MTDIKLPDGCRGSVAGDLEDHASVHGASGWSCTIFPDGWAWVEVPLLPLEEGKPYAMISIRCSGESEPVNFLSDAYEDVYESCLDMHEPPEPHDVTQALEWCRQSLEQWRKQQETQP